MENIIDQISQIDSFAFENKKRNEKILLKKKQEYEDIILSYKKEKIENAKIRAQTMTEEAEKFVLENEKKQEDKIKKISSELEVKYFKAEKKLTEEIFNKLFVLEG
ncbi:hypothetical protein [Sedimentibacter sp. MB31-C6]|uniref:hypothetical protein n=1 Tax=Sedimentibacter sp. MB31-C6 TaxID=3109366 RepID=UPI002DDCFF8B|nr:hypothetical protein [Sedimentibacter sp. MB36-C1]WSI04117.1 hypothetical protein U8307_14120 [Sedimentibacter sp. MB36-C1]